MYCNIIELVPKYSMYDAVISIPLRTSYMRILHYTSTISIGGYS